MKKLLKICLSSLLCIALVAGCGSTGPVISDLSGIWTQCEDNKNSDVYLEATITDSTIIVNWKGTDDLSTYFAGDFEQPGEEVSKYSYTSTKDNSYKHDLLLSSNEDTITFTYKNGYLTWIIPGTIEDREIVMEKIQ